MRVVLLHSDWIEFEPVKVAKGIKNPEPVEKKPHRIEEALVALVTVEKGDNEDVVVQAVEDMLRVMREVKAERIVIYPWAHLSRNLASPEKAVEILTKLSESVKNNGIEVHRAPFGWYKAFRISVKGHPLAELSREFKADKEGKVKVKKGEKKFYIVSEEGEFVELEKADLSKFSEDFQNMVRKEALKEPAKGGKSIVHEYLSRFGFEWEPMADYGHMRLGPYAALIFDLVADYARIVARRSGIPVYEVRGTAFFDLKEKPVKEHADLFGDRLYTVETDKGTFVLRYAACHQQFAMVKDWIISYKNLPFGMLEIADSYRYEQSGETELSFRLRRFWMPDMHVFLRSEEEAKEKLLELQDLIIKEMEKLGRSYELLINIVSPRQFELYKDYLREIVARAGKPALVAVYPETGLNYYWTINIEYVIRDHLDRPREIGTVQIDVGNSKRFGITYVEGDEKKYPVIIHTAILGSIERYIYALFDTAIRKKKPMLPIWVSPIQVRIIPINNKLLNKADEIADKLEEEGFRVDIDDTDRTLDRKILDAEKEWVPYVVVLGEKEVASGQLSVRVREDGVQRKMSLEELIRELSEKTRGYPKRQIYFARYVSVRPKFLKL